MNPKEIEQTMLKIAHQEGPQTADLWPAIREKVLREQKKAPRRFLPRTRLGWALSIGLVLLLSTTAVFALNSLVHNALQLDPGLAYADMKKSGQEVNLTQTVAGSTVSLNWIYADENRIGLGVSIQGPAGAAYNSITPMRVVLTDAGGNIYPSAGGYGTPYEDGATVSVLTFSVPAAAQPLPPVLNLRLSVSLMAADPTWIARMPTTEPGSKIEGPIGPEAGPFEFAFSASPAPASKVSLNQTIESAGVSLTLKSVSVSMSETQAELCYGSSSPAMLDWAPIFQLDVGTPVGMGESGSGSVPIAGTPCRMVLINLPLSTHKGVWTLTVNEIVGFAPDDSRPERLAGPWIFRFEMK